MSEDDFVTWCVDFEVKRIGLDSFFVTLCFAFNVRVILLMTFEYPAVDGGSGTGSIDLRIYFQCS